VQNNPGGVDRATQAASASGRQLVTGLAKHALRVRYAGEHARSDLLTQSFERFSQCVRYGRSTKFRAQRTRCGHLQKSFHLRQVTERVVAVLHGSSRSMKVAGLNCKGSESSLQDPHV
jgi:hypothetical protein